MAVIEIILLVIAYSALTIALFLEFLCYRRKMETIETIIFTISLLLLIISISTSPLFPSLTGSSESSITTLMSMILVSVTTLFHALSERKHKIKSWVKYTHLHIIHSTCFVF